MNFEELENLLEKVKICPNCGSKEGFWLAAQLYKKSLQCKHCGAIIEFHDIMQNEDRRKKPRHQNFSKK